MPATRQKAEQGAQSRAQLLQAAVELLGEKGYSGVSIGAILERSGAQRSALYWHFGSKSGLILAALEHETEHWVDRVQTAVNQAHSPVGQLDRLIDYIREAVADPDKRSMVFSLLLERGRANAELKAAINDAFKALRQTLAEGFAAAVPVLAVDRARTIADAFVDTADGIFIRFLAETDRDALERALAELRRSTLLRLTHEINRAARKARGTEKRRA